MKLAAITKSSIVFAFIFGMVFACGHAIWQGFLAPYLIPPSKPNFTNTGQTLYKDHPQVLKFTPPPAPKAQKFIPNTSEIKYQGTVNVSRGLVLRNEPKQGASRTGGVEYKAKVSVLKETPDKEWIFIEIDSTKQTGWVRSGNIFRN